MKLELGIMAGAESKAWLADLTKVVARMEAAADKIAGKPGKLASTPESEEEPETEAAEAPETEEEEEDFAPKVKKAAKKTAASFDDEEDDAPAPAAAEPEEEEEDFTAPPKKAAKATKKAITLDDVNDACKAKAKAVGGKPGREKVLSILKKNFKTESVSELKPEQYAKCVELMAV